MALNADTCASVSSVDNMDELEETENARRRYEDGARVGRKWVDRNASLIALATEPLGCRKPAISSVTGGV